MPLPPPRRRRRKMITTITTTRRPITPRARRLPTRITPTTIRVDIKPVLRTPTALPRHITSRLTTARRRVPTVGVTTPKSP